MKNNNNISYDAIKQTIILFVLLFILYQTKYLSEIIYTIMSFIVVLFQITIPSKIIAKYNQDLNDYNINININYIKIKKELAYLLTAAIIFFLPYIFIYIKYFNLKFNFTIPPSWPLEIILQIFVVAMPEEIFYRGFLQNALLKRFSIFQSIVITNIFFALSHLFAGFNPMRILTFFPGLVFSWLSHKNKSLFSAILFHALCNLLGQFLWYSTK